MKHVKLTNLASKTLSWDFFLSHVARKILFTDLTLKLAPAYNFCS